MIPRTYPEPMVARVIGVKKPRLVELRKASCVREADWVLSHAVVAYTESGLGKILTALALKADAFTWPEGCTMDDDSQESADAPAEATARQDGAMEDVAFVEKKGADVAAAAAGVIKLETLEAQRVLATLKVTRVARNPKIIFARAAGPDAGEVRVRVASNVNFIPGMQLRARQSTHQADLFFLEGRCPRWRGRW